MCSSHRVVLSRALTTLQLHSLRTYQYLSLNSSVHELQTARFESRIEFRIRVAPRTPPTET